VLVEALETKANKLFHDSSLKASWLQVESSICESFI